MSKYRSKKITVNGITYDSVKEYRRHAELLLLERAGAIRDLKRQVKYTLLPPQKCPTTGRTLERGITYVADFTYLDGQNLVVEDVKGYKGGGAYSIFTIKRKMMLYFHGIRIKEV